MDIFSKREGPRAEDVKAKRLISENMPVIRKLADQLSGGGYTRMRQQEAKRREQPKLDGLMIYDLKGSVRNDTPEPYVKVSLNNRVVLADKSSGLQIQMLGEIRGNFMSKKLVLATKENGFLSPLDDDLYTRLKHLEGVEITRDFTEKDLANELESVLDLKST
ncbi:MAG: hypothetical protein KJ731_05710 [Alphaproteobacteria bacterium]|nr:hypothetical protein [Alphaproteobacteria bacterium]MBU1280825.1 hypothetical protein [Alphaproteobacteria bacterium]MBU1575249.1 hypothetical protein [Alphaproteobacteria bacterium]MBU1827959.1 hypothetical protein [Alphaproteobacteria bacterium]MBU2076693.1 hypothetical protein [Alphaproteobacteria bacterium]